MTAAFPSNAASLAVKANRRAALLRFAGGFAALLAIALSGLFIIQAGVFSPPAPKDVKPAATVANPEQITGQNSRITGLDKNQRPYEIRAKSGQQDKIIETLVHLQSVEGAFERPSGARLDVTASTARYDTKSRDLELQGNVQFAEASRFKAVMDKALVNMDNQVLTSKSPVEVEMQDSKIKADSLTISDNGNRIVFRGGVKAHFVTKPE